MITGEDIAGLLQDDLDNIFFFTRERISWSISDMKASVTSWWDTQPGQYQVGKAIGLIALGALDLLAGGRADLALGRHGEYAGGNQCEQQENN